MGIDYRAEAEQLMAKLRAPCHAAQGAEARHSAMQPGHQQAPIIIQSMQHCVIHFGCPLAAQPSTKA